MTFGRPIRLAIPRGSLWFGNLAAALIEGIKRIDRWQLDRRAARESDVERLMAWANRIEASDPGLASDLRGAAMRASSGKDA
jgi:hypothetical protein